MVVCRKGVRSGSAGGSASTKAMVSKGKGKEVGRGGEVIGDDPEADIIDYDERMRAYTRAMIESDEGDGRGMDGGARSQFLSVFFQSPLLSHEGGVSLANPVMASASAARHPPVCWKVEEEGKAQGGAVGRVLVEKHAPIRARLGVIVDAEHERKVQEQVKAPHAEDRGPKIMQSCTLRTYRGLEARRHPAADMLPPPRGVTPSLEWMASTCSASLKYRLMPDQVTSEVCTEGGLTRHQMEQRMKRCQRTTWGSMLQGFQDEPYGAQDLFPYAPKP